MTHNRAERYKLFYVTSVIKKRIIFMRILEINEYASFTYTYVILSQLQLHALFMIMLVCSFDSSSSNRTATVKYFDGHMVLWMHLMQISLLCMLFSF